MLEVASGYSRMEPESYQVEVLHFLNPHLIWVEVLQSPLPKSRENFYFEQIGVYGIIPLECTLDLENECLKKTKTTVWTSAALKLMHCVLSGCKEVWFTPIFMDRRSTIFDGNVHKFGELTVKKQNGSLKKLSHVLKKAMLAHQDELAFHKYCCTGNIKTKLDSEQTLEVISVLKQSYKKSDIPKNHWEKSIQEHVSVFESSKHNLDIIKKTLRDVSTFDLHKRLMLTEDEIIKNKSHDFNMCKGIDVDYIGRGIRSPRSRSSKMNESGELEEHPTNAAEDNRLDVESPDLVIEESLSVEPLSVSKQSVSEHKYSRNFSVSPEDENERKSRGSEDIHTSPADIPYKRLAGYSPKNKSVQRPKRIPDYDEENEELVVIGPAGSDLGNLKVTTRPKYKMALKTEQEIKIIHDKTAIEREEEKNNVWQAVDSEVNFSIGRNKQVPVEMSVDKLVATIDDQEKKPTGLRLDSSYSSSTPSENTISLDKIHESSNSLNSCLDEEALIVKGAHERNIIRVEHYLPTNYESASNNSNDTVNSKLNISLGKKTTSSILASKLKAFKKLEALQKKKRAGELSDTSSENVFVSSREDVNVMVTVNKVENPRVEDINGKVAVNNKKNSRVENVYGEVENPRVEGIDGKVTAMKENSRFEDTSGMETARKKEYLKVSIDKLRKHISDSDSDSSIASITCKQKLKEAPEIPTFQPSLNNSHNLLEQIADKISVNPFRNVDQSMYKFIDKLVSPVLMVHSKMKKRIQPVLDLKNFNFNRIIHRALTEMSVKQPMTLQTVSWFSILRGYSFFMVSPMSSGKTMGYLPAVCRLVSDQNTDDFSDSCGPICIIVGATARSVVSIAGLCKRFLDKSKTVLCSYAGVDDVEIPTLLLNGCHVLVATPSSLVRILNLGNFSLDLTRLTVTVLDDCEKIDECYTSEVKIFLQKIKKMLKSRVNKEQKVQYVAASRLWCDFLSPLAIKAPNSVICIGSYQECVLYSKAHTSVNWVESKNKTAAVLEFLKDLDHSKRSVIVCRNDDEVKTVSDVLSSENYKVFSARTHMSLDALYKLNNEWCDYEVPIIGPVLVCCDVNLAHLNVTNASYLVQYSLPDLYSSFCKRFSVLVDNYASIYDEGKNKCHAVKTKILLDENNVEQLPKILFFIERCTKDIPDALKAISSKIVAEKELSKADSFVPICDNVLSFGKCTDFWCRQRHLLFREYDEPPEWMPKTGTITFKIILYHSPAHFSVRLLSQTVNDNVIQFKNTYSSLALKMGLHFRNEDNRQLHGIPKPGDICAVSLKINVFERCRVIKVISYANDHADTVLVNMIDEEKWEVVKGFHLFYLPDVLKNILTYTAQIRLACIQPKDKDCTFSDLSKDFLINMMKKEDDLYLRAKVVTGVGSSIIVEKIEACQDLKSLGETVVRYNFKEELCKSHALANVDHITNLEEFFRISGMTLHCVDKESITSSVNLQKLLIPQWAHLESDENPLVYFSSAQTPEKFYIRLVKFQGCLDNLTKDIQAYVKTVRELKGQEQATFENGAYVLAKFPDDSLYYRARIDLLNKVKDTRKIQCFFVDHGDWRSVSNRDIVPMVERFISVMPFQAIECRLVGLKPVGKVWTEFSTKLFCDLCFQDSTDDLKELYVKYFVKDKAECTGGHKYGIVMFDTSSDQDVIINKVLLEANLAAEKDDELMFLETVGFKRPYKAKDDSEVEWETEAALYDDHKYQRTITTKAAVANNPDPYSFEEESNGSTGSWEVNLSMEDIAVLMEQAKPLEKQNTNTQLPAITMSPGNELKNDNKLKSNNTLTELCLSDVSKSECLSKLSNYEIIENPNKNDDTLDSDDLTSPENLSMEFLNSSSSPSKLRRPRLKWYETKSSVTIKVEIAEIEEYEIDIGERTLKFETFAHGTEYGFTLDLFGVMKPKSCSHSPKGLYVLIKFEKLIKMMWVNLTRDSESKRWISYDHESIDIASEEDDDDIPLKKRELLKFVTETHNSGSDDSDDEYGNFKDDTIHRSKYDSD